MAAFELAYRKRRTQRMSVCRPKHGILLYGCEWQECPSFCCTAGVKRGRGIFGVQSPKLPVAWLPFYAPFDPISVV